ncbi:MAG: YceI family protein, partial [Saprospiraceae bacterium]|nr:YceI family protein [Saprospiraceae bacterium]
SFSRPISWIADTTHSSVQFRARHTDVHDVIGWIARYDIEVVSQRFDFSDAKIQATTDMGSLVMPNMGMVGNLQNTDLFDVQTYPMASFQGNVEKVRWNGTSEIGGELTIKDVTLPIKLEGTFNGFAHREAHGLPGFTIHGAFNRYDFNIGSREGNLETEQAIADSIFFTANLRLYVKE